LSGPDFSVRATLVAIVLSRHAVSASIFFSISAFRVAALSRSSL
jgi:hypothetical protein